MIDFIVSALAPSRLLMVVAQLPIVVRGSLLPCTEYMANCPCGKRLIVALHNVHGQCPCGKGLVVTLLDKCGQIGVLAILAFGNVHTVFGILTVLAFGDVHAFGNLHAISSVLAMLNLGAFVLLIVASRNMVVLASCNQQHENSIVAWESFQSSLAFIFYCHCSLQYDIKK
jgi:hypothetical protein